MSSSAPSGISLHEEMLSDFHRGLFKLKNLKNLGAQRFNMDSKLMMLNLKKERLEAQLQYSRVESRITEMKLQVADKQIKYELARRRRFFSACVARSRLRRASTTMKPSPTPTEKELPAIEGTEAPRILEKNAVEASTQVNLDIDQVEQKPQKTADEEKRKNDRKRQPAEKDAASKERTESSRVATDETPRHETARAASKEKENQRKKSQTDVENTRTNKNERSKKYCSKHKERSEARKSSKDNRKTETNTNNVPSASNNIHMNNDKPKRDYERKEGHARKRCDDKYTKVDKPLKSILKTSKTKINDGENSHTNLACNVEIPVAKVEINNNEERSQDNDRKNNDNTAKVPMPINNIKTYTDTEKADTTYVLELTDPSLIYHIQEMCDQPKNTLDVSGEWRVKPELSSSAETLVLQEGIED